MKDYNKILKSDERAVFDLLDLYSRYGYSRFKLENSLKEIRDELSSRHVIDHKVKQEKMTK